MANYANDFSLGCAECGGTCGGMAELECGACGMGDLGAYGPSEAEVTVTAVMNGDIANELNAARQQSADDNAFTFNALTAAQKSGNFDAVATAQAARNAFMKQNESLQNAISKYNSLAQAIQTYSLNQWQPPQLGLAPIVIVGIGAAALIAASYAFSNAMSAWRGDANSARGYLDQLSTVLNSGGIAVERTAGAVQSTLWTYVGVGAISLALYVAYQKYGHKLKMKRAK